MSPVHPNSVSMSTRLAGLVLLACLGPWAAASAAQLFPKGDPAKGQALHQQKCASCHNSMMPDGKGEELYSEDFRKMKSASELRTMVEFCANRSRAGWFEEEIEHATRFLNDRFYQFKR